MFERCVKMPDGTLAYHHEVVEITHHREGFTYISVESDGFNNSLEHPLDMVLDFDSAENWVKVQPAYAEYVDEAQEKLDEVLAILTDEQAASVLDVFDEWKLGVAYSVGDRIRYVNDLFKCLQAHTSQLGWEPPEAVSLWARIFNPNPDFIPVWEQPDSVNPYMKGDKVHYPGFEDPVYESTIDNNVWSPESYPQGWQLVEDGE